MFNYLVSKWLLVTILLFKISVSPSQQIDSTWQVYFETADSFKAKGDVQQTLAFYFKAFRKAEDDSNLWGIAMTSERLGDLHEKYYRYQESIPYLKRSYSITKEMDSVDFLANIANSIAWNYIKIDLPDSALRYSEEAVGLFKKSNKQDVLNYCIALESLGEIYSKKARYKDATLTLDICMDLGIKANHVVIIGFTHYGIALNEFNQGKIGMALRHIEKCIPVAELYATGELLADVYKLAYQIFIANNLSTKAFQFLEKYTLLKDKLHSEDIEKKAAIVNASYEIQKKEDDLRISNQRNAIQQFEIQQQRIILYISIGLVIVIFIIGALVYGRIQGERKFEQQELKHKKEEMEQARKVQLSLLPKNPLDDDSFSVVGKMITASEVGGDYYDYIKLDENRILLAFGDATGHGMTAGMLVTITKVTLINNLNLLKETNNVVPLAKVINESILSSISVKGIGMALQLCIIDKLNKKISLTSCGMPYPILMNTQSKILRTIEIRQPPLGFFRATKIELTELDFNDSTKLILVSDGILERFNPIKEEYGLDRLLGSIRSVCKADTCAMVDTIYTDTEAFAEGTANHDDMTVLVACLK